MNITETQTVYKKVYTTPSRLRLSGYLGNFPEEADLSPLIIIYTPGVEVQPTLPGTKLFAFRTLKAAIEWQWGNEIWEAQGTNVKPMKRFMFTHYRDIGRLSKKWWSGKSTHSLVNLVILQTGHAPKGTVVCDSLILTKPVHLLHEEV